MGYIKLSFFFERIRLYTSKIFFNFANTTYRHVATRKTLYIVVPNGQRFALSALFAQSSLNGILLGCGCSNYGAD